jgi:PAS domain S-box-containing protein
LVAANPPVYSEKSTILADGFKGWLFNCARSFPMTMIQPTITPESRYFPSRIALLAAAELVLIALLLRLSNSPAFFCAAIACSLCSIQLGILLMNRFQVNTRKIRRLARQAEFSSQSIFITDGDGRIKWTNSRFTRLTGFYLSEIAGKTFGMVLHGHATNTMAVEQIRRHMRLGQPFETEVLIYNRAGETLWVFCKGEPVRDTRGQLTHFIITQTDVSDQHRLIQELGQSSTIDSRADDLNRQLQSLSYRDERDQLQNLMTGLKSRIETCAAALPPTAIENAEKHSADQQNRQG